MPSAITSKKRHLLEPISYDELLNNAGMSGFVSFLERPASAVVEAPPGPPETLKFPRRARILKAAVAEDGHSLAEQAVYEALWKIAAPLTDLTDSDRSVRIGYHRLANLTRLSWVSVKANLRSLEKKLAIEVIGAENSATREGKCYLIYTRSSILERRKKAGLEWVRRTRGVELLHKPFLGV
jgi:hypothetical protein